MFTQDVNGLSNAEIMRYVPSVFASGKHDSRSERYAYISTGTVVDALRAEGFIPTTAMQCKSRDASRSGFTKHLLRLRQIDDLGYGKADVHEVVLINSHNGSSAYDLMSGVFRFICSNGMIVGDIAESLKVYHKGNVVDRVVDSTLRIVEEGETVMADIATMKTIELTRPEQLLLAEYAVKARFGSDEEKKTIYQPTDLLRIHRSEDAKNDLYTVFNTIQENAIRGGISRRDAQGKRHTTREVKGIDQLVKTNSLLWQFAQKMMELKQA